MNSCPWLLVFRVLSIVALYYGILLFCLVVVFFKTTMERLSSLKVCTGLPLKKQVAFVVKSSHVLTIDVLKHEP